MTIELNPVGIRCGLACTYCYESDMRAAGNFGSPQYSMDAMKQGLAEELASSHGSSWTMHGGEPLLMPIKDIEQMWAWGKAQGHALGIQTGGSLWTSEHTALALRYAVHVGMSIDGPDEMNDLREAAGGKLDKTRQLTAQSHAALRQLCEAGAPTSVIIVLHALNMAPARRARFCAWLRELSDMGVRGIRFHPMELDDRAAQHAPTVEEYLQFYRDMRDWFAREQLQFRIDMIEDIEKLMRGNDDWTTCTWNSCDPYTTAAVHGVDGQGVRTNCGRTQKDGVAAPKADVAGFERYLSLYQTPQAEGGCQGCRFFVVCKGQCPGEGIDGDWRNRSAYCPLYFGLCEDEELRMLARDEVPVSRAPDRELIEGRMVAAWEKGMRISIAQARRNGSTSPNWEHGDHTDDGCQGCHGDKPHGDHTDGALPAVPHGDSHGDRPHGDSDHGDRG